MAIAESLYNIFGVFFLLISVVTFVIKSDKVCYPGWLKACFSAIVGIMDFSLSKLYGKFQCNVLGLRIAAAVFAIISTVTALYFCTFRIEMRDRQVEVRSLFLRKKLCLNNTDTIKFVGDGDAITLLVGKDRVKVSRFMHGYDGFCKKLFEEESLLKFLTA